MVKQISDAPAPAAVGPYSQATEAGNLVFLSGQIAINPETSELVPGGVEEQTQQVMSNLKAVLNHLNLDFSNVARAEIFLKSMDDYKTVNALYEEALGDAKPARQAVEVSKLPLDVDVEISMIAVKE